MSHIKDFPLLINWLRKSGKFCVVCWVWWVWWAGWLAPNSFVSALGILKMVHQVRLKMFSLKMVDYSTSLLSLSTWNYFWRTSRLDHSGPFLLSELFYGTPPSCFDDVLAEGGELIHVLPLAVHLTFFWRTRGIILKHSYFLNLFVGPLLRA